MEERTNRQVAEEFFRKAEDFIRKERGGNPTLLSDLRTFRAGMMQTADEKLAAHSFDKLLVFCQGWDQDAELVPYVEAARRWCAQVGVRSLHQ